MTKEEAETKWCPMMQVAAASHFNDIAYGDNRGGGDENHQCIASECMMWVQDYGMPNPKTGIAKLKVDKGHCGLAK